MFPYGISSPLVSVLLCTLFMASIWLSQWTLVKFRPLQADPLLQNPGRESAEDYSY
jgi:hypothetical protein